MAGPCARVLSSWIEAIQDVNQTLRLWWDTLTTHGGGLVTCGRQANITLERAGFLYQSGTVKLGRLTAYGIKHQ